MKKLPILLAAALMGACAPALAQTSDVPLPRPRPDLERLREARTTLTDCKAVSSWVGPGHVVQHAVIKCAPPDGRTVAPAKDPSQ